MKILFLSPQSTAFLSTYTPPWMGEASQYWSYSDTDHISITSRVVFGSHKLPDGYELAFVPRNATVLGLVDPTSPTASSSYNVVQSSLFQRVARFFGLANSTSPNLSSSYSLVKAAAALLQSMYAFFTLYRSRGGKLRQYGYAAFGLTVVPYAVMSVLNLIGNLVTPNYPTLYFVRSEVMEEAERRRGSPFDYVVGRIKSFHELDTSDAIKDNWFKIAGFFEDRDDLLHVLSPGAKQGEKLMVSTMIPNTHPHRTVYVPACPRFQRTDNIQNMNYQEYLQHWPELLQQPLRFRILQFLQRQFPFLRRGWQRLTQAYQQSFQLYPQLLLQLLPPASNVMRPAERSLREVRRLLRLKQSGVVFNSLLFMVVCGIEIAIMGGLSRFREGQSTANQRVRTMAWFGFGCFYGFLFSFGMIQSTVPGMGMNGKWVIILGCCVPSVTGFMAVCQMLVEYGSCIRLNGSRIA
jgi:hypothetical protein